MAWVALAVLARLAIMARGFGPTGLVLEDPDNYLPLARSLASGEGFSLDGRLTAYRPPLYPLLLAPLARVLGPRIAWGVAGLHLVLGALTTGLAFQTARRWGLSPGRSLAAAAVVAVDPVLVSQSGAVMTETLAAALNALILVSLTAPGRLGPTLGGFGFGLSALCRPSAWPVLGLSALASMMLPPLPLRERALRTTLLVGLAVATAAPWAWRNKSAVGEAVWTTSHGGYTLFLANNRVYYDEVVNGPPGAVWTGDNQWRWWDSVNRSARGLSEPEADRLFRREALRVMADRPGDFAWATVARLGRFWGLAPSGAVYPWGFRALTAAWTLPLWMALARGLASPRTRAWPGVVAVAMILGLTLVHALYWTDMRMRAAAIPAVALVAATAGARNVSKDHSMMIQGTVEKK